MGEKVIEKADIFMRHGSFERPRFPTYRNFQLFISGTDFPLNARGRNEVRESLSGISNLQSVDFILSSPYRRAFESAQIVQEYLRSQYGNTVPLQVIDFLREIDVGSKVLSRKEFYTLLLKSYGRMELLKEAVFNKWRWGGGKEKPSDTEERIRKLLDIILRFHEEGCMRLLLVSHASFGRALRRFLDGRQVTLPRKEDQLLERGGLFYIAQTLDDNRFTLIIPES